MYVTLQDHSEGEPIDGDERIISINVSNGLLAPITPLFETKHHLVHGDELIIELSDFGLVSWNFNTGSIERRFRFFEFPDRISSLKWVSKGQSFSAKFYNVHTENAVEIIFEITGSVLSSNISKKYEYRNDEIASKNIPIIPGDQKVIFVQDSAFSVWSNALHRLEYLRLEHKNAILYLPNKERFILLIGPFFDSKLAQTALDLRSRRDKSVKLLLIRYWK